MPDSFPAITHVAVTVRDLGVSVPWYKALIGSDPVLDENTGPFHHTVFLMGGTLLGLHEFPDHVKGSKFDQVAVFWEHDDKVLRSGIIDENEENLTDAGGAVHVISTRKATFRDPDGIALEFFAPPG